MQEMRGNKDSVAIIGDRDITYVRGDFQNRIWLAVAAGILASGVINCAIIIILYAILRPAHVGMH